MSRSTVAIANELCKALEDLSFDCFGVFGTNSPKIDTYNKAFEVLDRCRGELKSHDLPRAESIDDAMMDLVDRLGSEYDKVDARSWRHLLIYAPKKETHPVAWMYDWADGDHLGVFKQRADKAVDDADITETPLYTHPRQPVQLSDDEIKNAVSHISFNEMTVFNIARAVIAAYEEKNK